MTFSKMTRTHFSSSHLYLYKKAFLLFFSLKFGSHLLSHTVTSAVPSAAWVLTIVFGIGTGVTPKRIATEKFCVLLFLRTLIIKQQMQVFFLTLFYLRKEVIQPHLPIRLPCYDFTPVIGPAFGSSPLKGWVTDFGRY